MNRDPAAVAQHYGRGGLLARILGGLAEAGKDIERLSIDDLAPIDEFHSRRRLATEELARMLAPGAANQLIDIGSGIGGPSRYLAATYGCRVSGVDLTDEFVAVASELTRRTGLADRVDFRVGSALDLPFPPASFDLAWTQNVAMNIADRPRFYGEIARVLKPGGRLALQDVAQGPAGPVHFPVMWADTPSLSFLRTPEETRTMLGGGVRCAGVGGQYRDRDRRGGGGAREGCGEPDRAAGVGGASRGGGQLPREDAQLASEFGGGAHAADQCGGGEGVSCSARERTAHHTNRRAIA
jgi:SAM-dependent methyltransferase